jgi:hypothetical protein
MTRLKSIVSHFRRHESFQVGRQRTLRTEGECKAPQTFFDAVAIDQSRQDSDPLPNSIRTKVESDGGLGSLKSHLLEGTFDGDESSGELSMERSFPDDEGGLRVYEESLWSPAGSSSLEYTVAGLHNEKESLLVMHSRDGSTTVQELNKAQLDQWFLSK